MERRFLIDIVGFAVVKGRDNSCAGVTMYIRTHLTSGIRYPRSSVNTGFAGIIVTWYKLS